PRAPISRYSPDRNNRALWRKTPPLNARCLGRRARWRGSRFPRAAHDRRASAGCEGREANDPKLGSCRRRRSAREDAASPWEGSCTCARAATRRARRGASGSVRGPSCRQPNAGRRLGQRSASVAPTCHGNDAPPAATHHGSRDVRFRVAARASIPQPRLVSDFPSFNVQHAPIGAFAALTLGHAHTRGGLAIERGRPGEQNVFVGWQDADAALHLLPFFVPHDDARAAFEVDANLRPPPAPSEAHGVERELGPSLDRFRWGPLTLEIVSPRAPLVDPDEASPEACRLALCPAVL